MAAIRKRMEVERTEQPQMIDVTNQPKPAGNYQPQMRRASDRGRGLENGRFLHPNTPFDHDITIPPEQCEEFIRGARTHHIQYAATKYSRGQVIRFRGYDRTIEQLTGHVIYARITCLTPEGAMGLPNDLAVMSIRLIGMVDRDKFPSLQTAKPPVLLHLIGQKPIGPT